MLNESLHATQEIMQKSGFKEKQNKQTINYKAWNWTDRLKQIAGSKKKS
jgi:hypothetical protein